MLSYLIPAYIDELGNCTKTKDTTGEHIINKTVKSVLKSICVEKMVDLRIAKRRAEKTLGQSNLIPIFLGSNDVYIPVKVRKPIVIRDGGYGYVNFVMIEKIMDKHIILKDRSSLDYIESKRCLLKRYKMAKALVENLSKRLGDVQYTDEKLKIPATREDILFLISEIGRLKMSIERIV
ncbi:MAG: hypothetical protein K0R09_1175 [Clostridiales bacterium]|jgi:hypothetical protein|nr:hypothetical protein [Clostridiales bacterium]